MCGICGIIDWGAHPHIDAAILKRMVWMVRHRGPDELGIYLDRRAGLGHARLSIIDLAGGAQPMSNGDDSLWITFNGEIYNYLEIRPDLEARGHRFKTHSDTEVILHLYEEYGPQCLEHMNGQFAFCIWDRRNGAAFMARDRLGIRPLHYARVGPRLLFGSEIKSLLAAPEVPAAIDPIALDQVFTFWAPLPPRTAFEGIRQLPPAHYLIATADDVRTERYWRAAFPPEGAATEGPEEEYAEGLREQLVRATRLRMRADVPVAAYLSGGLDSSLTSAVIRQFTDTDLMTFSVRFEDREFDEGEHQDAMVAALGTDHRSIEVARHDIARAFPEVIWHAETPILRTAPVPLHHLSGLVRDTGIKVVVTGEGADEVLGGYNIFKEDKVRRFWARQPDSPYRPLLLARLYPYIQRSDNRGGGAYWQRFFAKGLTDTADPCYSHRIRWHNTAALKRFFSADVRARIGAYDGIAEYGRTLPADFDTWAPLSKAQYTEITTFMAGYLLCSQGDRVSASHGVEGRFPFLDHHVVEYAARIPPKCKLRALEEKRVLRKAAQGLVPDPVRRRTKQPYRAPDSVAFFQGDGSGFVREALSERALRDAGCFEPRMVARLIEKCRGRGKVGASARDDMAFVGVLSTQLLYETMIRDFPRDEPVPDNAFRWRRAASGSRDAPSSERKESAD